MGYLDTAKESVLERAAGQITPSEHPIGQALADVFTGIESEQAQALATAYQAAGLKAPVAVNPDARRQQILDVADAVAGQQFGDWWWSEIAPQVLDRPEKARGYVGLDGDEWHDQLRRWYRTYHEAGVVNEPLDEADRGRLCEVADRHIRETFGCSLRDFVEDVINWSEGRAGQQLLAGQLQHHTQMIHRLAREIEAREERIAELEGRTYESQIDWENARLEIPDEV